VSESLEDHLRRGTRNFSKALGEDEAFTLARDLASELARAHAEVPPRHPDLAPEGIAFEDGHPRLGPSRNGGSVGEDLFLLGSLLQWMATGEEPVVSWRLDGPPRAPLSTLRRQAVMAALTSPVPEGGVATADEAARALETALNGEPGGAPPWPLFRGDPGRGGARPTPSPSTLTPAWHAMVGGVVASPVLTTSLVLAPTADGRLLFLDRERGGRVHELRVGSALESSPALLGELLHVGTDDGEVVGVGVRDGRIAYRAKVGDVVRSSPLPASDRLLVGVVEGKTGGGVVALDAATGKSLWKRKLGAVFSSPTLAGSLALVGSDDGSVHALDIAQGTVVWSRALSERVRATPAVVGELAVVADFKGRVSALKTADGSVLWARELGRPVYSSACVQGDLCVVGCHDGRVYAFRLATGEPAFELATKGPVVSSPVAVGDRFLAASTDGQLYLFDGSGRELLRISVAAEGIQSSPALDGETVVLGSGRGLHAFRLSA
jgi:eukaryotic-like serine/threonine-protein kinase